MAEFFVDTHAQSGGEHLVHFSHCTQLPAADTLYLGSIATTRSALDQARKKFLKVAACGACAPRAAAPAPVAEG